MKIHVAAVDHRHGTNLYASRTEAGLLGKLSAYCQASWENDGPEIEFSELTDDADIVRLYFEHQSQCGDEWHVQEEIDVGPDAERDAAILDLHAGIHEAIRQFDRLRATLPDSEALGDLRTALLGLRDGLDELVGRIDQVEESGHG